MVCSCFLLIYVSLLSLNLLMRTAASVNLTSPEEDDTEWVVKQYSVDPYLELPRYAIKIDWSRGPITVSLDI